LRFREDILRGVRLFAIVFAAILVCVAAYRILRASDVPGVAAEGTPPTEEAAQPSSEPAPAADATAAETHPLVVPEPPPVGGKQVRTHPRSVNGSDVPPPPPSAPAVARARRTTPPSGKEFESSDTVALPAAPVEEAADTKQMTPQQKVGYKSLLDANTKHPPTEYVAPPQANDDPVEAQPKGNRFFKAIGKIFRSGKKDAEPSAIQPKQ
jgi:hypothetical protein